MNESAHQRALFLWASHAAGTRPELRMLFAIPNAGKRSKASGGRGKSEGMKAGVPDMCLPVKRGGYGGLFIELKRPSALGKPRGKPTPEQLQWLGDLQAYGQFAMICYGWDEARQAIEAYLDCRA